MVWVLVSKVTIDDTFITTIPTQKEFLSLVFSIELAFF